MLSKLILIFNLKNKLTLKIARLTYVSIQIVRMQLIFAHLEVVGRGNKTQLQVDENLHFVT